MACTYTTKHLKGEIVNLTHSLHKVHALDNLDIKVWSGNHDVFYIDTSLNPVPNAQVCYFNNVWFMF